VTEPKITTRAQVTERTSRPIVPVATGLNPSITDIAVVSGNQQKEAVVTPSDEKRGEGGVREVMRKHMTLAIDEAMAAIPNLIYIGEDVVHGGYYLVTDGLAKKYPIRVRDFPPEETALIGVGMGFAQAGLLPIVEIPYAKYLDCGADMFFEAALMNWLSNHKQPNGMIFRLQGFGRGVFGGNFHTHNMLHIPPGIDVVCYSNGPDWARGFRYALKQAQAGRVGTTLFLSPSPYLP
jgi:2-oxoisovalerate dehydrogenase E1 component